MSKDSIFIVIEGLDGSGKSTAARRLTELLNLTFKDKIKLTYEPHDASCAGLFIRQVLKKKIKNFDHHVLALSYAANRLDHCSRQIVPWLEDENGRMVISDRYYLSSLVYQSRPDFSFEEVMKLNEKAIKPDLIFFMNVSNEICYQRMNIRNQPKELFEGNLSETREKYFNAIEYLREKNGDKIVEIDGGGTIEQTVTALCEKLVEFYPTLKANIDFEAISKSTAFNENIDYSIEKFIEKLNNAQDIETQINDLSFDKKGIVFLEYLKELGYQIEKKSGSTHYDAFELTYNLPGNLKQRGMALLINENQRYDQILSSATELYELSDFIFVFMNGSSKLVTKYHERDRIEFFNSNNETAVSLFPTTQLVTQKDLATYIEQKMLEKTKT